MSEETTPGSYFVSNYPPYSYWNAEQVAAAHAALDRPARAGAPLGVYVHIPFCRKRCHFCYFKVYTGKDSADIDRYLDRIAATGYDGWVGLEYKPSGASADAFDWLPRARRATN